MLLFCPPPFIKAIVTLLSTLPSSTFFSSLCHSQSLSTYSYRQWTSTFPINNQILSLEAEQAISSEPAVVAAPAPAGDDNKPTENAPLDKKALAAKAKADKAKAALAAKQAKADAAAAAKKIKADAAAEAKQAKADAKKAKDAEKAAAAQAKKDAAAAKKKK